MRVIVFFDLPVVTEHDRREYRLFRKYLVRNGFIMMQESVYSKLCLNSSSADLAVGGLKKNRPKKGLVQVIRITEKQYSKMEFIVGERINEVLDSDERLVVI